MKSIQDIINHYKKEDKPMRDIDNDELEEDRQHRFNQRLQHRLATCGDRDYPAALARQDIIQVEEERLRLMGIVDISEGEK
jgi:hypothetical protein